MGNNSKHILTNKFHFSNFLSSKVQFCIFVSIMIIMFFNIESFKRQPILYIIPTLSLAIFIYTLMIKTLLVKKIDNALDIVEQYENRLEIFMNKYDMKNKSEDGLEIKLRDIVDNNRIYPHEDQILAKELLDILLSHPSVKK